ncbi:MAG TPA: hypothetical protein VFZ32_02610 [Micromonosporaceae bacterium]
MKTALVTGIGTVITAAATAGQVTLAGVGALILAGIAVTCWVIKDNSRTQNAVAIIRAARSGTDPQPVTDADQIPEGQVDSGDAR